jgi:hypothetical protein
MGASKVFNAADVTEALVVNGASLSSGAGLATISANTQFFTRARKNELTLADSYARGRDLRTSNKCGYQTTAVLTDTDLVQSNFPVSIVSRAYFLGPEERTAFASNAFNQIVECCQRLTESTTQAASKTFRVDQFQNAASTLYVCPIVKTSLAYNSYFDFGGAFDYIRQRTFPAITSIELSTNGAVLYQASDETFFRMVQPYAHHSNVLPWFRRVYAMNFGIRANARGPVQANGYMNFSRTANAMITITFPSNIWATHTDGSDGVLGNPTVSTSTTVQLLFIVWNYNVSFLQASLCLVMRLTFCCCNYTHSLYLLIFVCLVYSNRCFNTAVALRATSTRRATTLCKKATTRKASKASKEKKSCAKMCETICASVNLPCLFSKRLFIVCVCLHRFKPSMLKHVSL